MWQFSMKSPGRSFISNVFKINDFDALNRDVSTLKDLLFYSLRIGCRNTTEKKQTNIICISNQDKTLR